MSIHNFSFLTYQTKVLGGGRALPLNGFGKFVVRTHLVAAFESFHLWNGMSLSNCYRPIVCKQTFLHGTPSCLLSLVSFQELYWRMNLLHTDRYTFDVSLARTSDVYVGVFKPGTDPTRFNSSSSHVWLIRAPNASLIGQGKRCRFASPIGNQNITALLIHSHSDRRFRVGDVLTVQLDMQEGSLRFFRKNRWEWCTLPMQ